MWERKRKERVEKYDPMNFDFCPPPHPWELKFNHHCVIHVSDINRHYIKYSILPEHQQYLLHRGATAVGRQTYFRTILRAAIGIVNKFLLKKCAVFRSIRDT